MTSSFADSVVARLPWGISGAEWIDPTLVVSGEGFSLSITCPWRVVGDEGILFSHSDTDVEDRVWDLVGAEVVRIENLGVPGYQDPRFHLTGNLRLDLFADTDLDPWVLRSGEDIVIVGP